MKSIKNPILTGILGTWFFAGTNLFAADFALKTGELQPPESLASEISSVLQEKAYQLSKDGEPAMKFWLRQEIPLKAKPDSMGDALKQISETTLLGAVAVKQDGFRDYRDDRIMKGVYTMRLGLQPQDGNHLGTSVFPFFGVLVPASRDQALDAVTDYDTLVDKSAEDTATEHPVILSLTPVYGNAGGLPKITSPRPAPDHKVIRLSTPAKIGDSSEKTDIVFDIVFVGHGEL